MCSFHGMPCGVPGSSSNKTEGGTANAAEIVELPPKKEAENEKPPPKEEAETEQQPSKRRRT